LNVIRSHRSFDAFVIRDVGGDSEPADHSLRVKIDLLMKYGDSPACALDRIAILPFHDSHKVEFAGPDDCSRMASRTKPGCVQKTACVAWTLSRNSARAGAGTTNLSTLSTSALVLKSPPLFFVESKFD
jgi:hypothetical protein